MADPVTPAASGSMFWRAFVASGAAVLAIGLGLMLWYGNQIVLLAFAGVLLSVMLRAPARWLHRRLRLPEKLALFLEIIVVLGTLSLVIVLAAPSVAEQITLLQQEIPRSYHEARATLQNSGIGRTLEKVLPRGDEIPWTRLAGSAAGLLSNVAGVVFAAVVFLVVGLFLAINPSVYRDNLILLVPPASRDRVRDLLAEMADTLRSWLFGRLVGMAFIGVTTGIGLWILGAPLALALGVLAALLAFIPNLGPVLSAVPAVLVSMTQGWTQVALVVGLYIVLQAIDNNVVTPLIEQRMVNLPPALTALSQILLGLLFGILGLFLATPITACAVILIRKVYVEGTLGEPAPTRTATD
jgi:predicted PurR-regulated permease PerM